LADTGKIAPRVDAGHFGVAAVGEGYRVIESGIAASEIVIDIRP
jgi:hypothetical protein